MCGGKGQSNLCGKSYDYKTKLRKNGNVRFASRHSYFIKECGCNRENPMIY